MNSNILFLLLLTAGCALHIDETASLFSRLSEEKIRLEISFKQGVNPIKVEYKDIPAHWQQHNGILQIHTNNNETHFEILVKVTEEQNKQSEIHALIIIENNEFQIKQIQSHSQTSRNKKVKEILRDIHAYQNSTMSLYSQSTNSMYAEMPSSNELLVSLRETNVLAIAKTIQSVRISSSLSCSDKIQYLRSMFKIAQQEQRKLKDEEQKLNQKILEQIKQIQSLKAEQKQIEDEISSLDIYDLHQKLSQQLKRLYQSYENYNKVKIFQQNLIIEYQKQSQKLKEFDKIQEQSSKVLSEKEQRLKDSQKLVMLRFKEYQDSIIGRNNARIELEVERSKLQKIEAEKKAKGNILQGFFKKIQNYPNILSELKIVYHKIEVDVNRCRKQLTQASLNKISLEDKLMKLKALIYTQENQLNQTKSMSDPSHTLMFLEKVKSNVKEKSSELLDLCAERKAEEIKAQILPKYNHFQEIQYELSETQFRQYLRKTFNFHFTESINSKKVRINSLKVTSDRWKNEYGVLSMRREGVECEESSEKQFSYGKGKVKYIGREMIISIEEMEKYLLLDLCTRIQFRGALPKENSTVLWKGVRRWDHGYEAQNIFILQN